MWLFVAILIIIVLYLIVLSSSKAGELKEEKYSTEKTIRNLQKENEELKNIRLNAERRATAYAGKIKGIENVILGEGTIVDKYDKINKLLFLDKNNNSN